MRWTIPPFSGKWVKPCENSHIILVLRFSVCVCSGKRRQWNTQREKRTTKRAALNRCVCVWFPARLDISVFQKDCLFGLTCLALLWLVVCVRLCPFVSAASLHIYPLLYFVWTCLLDSFPHFYYLRICSHNKYKITNKVSPFHLLFLFFFLFYFGCPISVLDSIRY